jgi:hypothetical protein
MPRRFMKVQCTTCGAVYSILTPLGGFPAPCALCKPVGKGTIMPLKD